MDAEYKNERGLPPLPAPDGKICDLIDMLEGNCCNLPDAGNPPHFDSQIAELFNEAQRMRMAGDLRSAHVNFLKIFETQRSISSMVLYSWVCIFPLAKDFGHAQFVLQLAETNTFRGQKWYCFGSKSALNMLLIPIPKEIDSLQAMRYQSENAVDYNNREAVEASIAKLGATILSGRHDTNYPMTSIESSNATSGSIPAATRLTSSTSVVVTSNMTMGSNTS